MQSSWLLPFYDSEQPLPLLIQSLEVLAGEKCDGFRPITDSPAAGS
jgi:hypothetical protein